MSKYYYILFLLSYVIPLCTLPAYALPVYIDKNEWKLWVSEHGGLTIETGGDKYEINSSFSSPGEKISWNQLSTTLNSQTLQKISVNQISTSIVEVVADFQIYSINRRIELQDHKIKISDTISNNSNQDLGIITWHAIHGASFLSHIYLGGQYRSGRIKDMARWLLQKSMTVSLMAENPSIFIQNNTSAFGLLAEDDLFRIKMIADIPDFLSKSVQFGVENFALLANKKYKFEWGMYPLKKEDTYFSFINKIRKEWNVNFTLNGPLDWFVITENLDLLHDRLKLKEYFERKRLGFVALTPWVDFDNFDRRTNTYLNRIELSKLLKFAYSQIKQASPGTKILGSMQGNLWTLPSHTIEKLYNSLSKDRLKEQPYFATDLESDIINSISDPMKEAFISNEFNQRSFWLFYPVENYHTGKIFDQKYHTIATVVEVVDGNPQFKNWIEEADYLLKQNGMDGIYIDQFSVAFSPDSKQRFSHAKWDGVSVDIDAETGGIVRKYTDVSYVGISARKKFADYVLGQGVPLVANTPAVSKELQSLPIHRFLEGIGYIDPFKDKGKMPEWQNFIAKAHLGTPIVLGEKPYRFGNKGMLAYSEIYFQTMITWLRHGLLFYNYGNDLPKTGPGSGEYGPINHMYPITPVELGEGFVIGKERIVTTISRKFDWNNLKKPEVLVFDTSGRKIESAPNIISTDTGWIVDMVIKNWTQIAVIEAANDVDL